MIRKATLADLDFLIQIDLKKEGLTLTEESQMMNEDLRLHREKIMKFLIDENRGAFVYEEDNAGNRIGMIMYSIANRDEKYPPSWKTIFHELDRKLFQEDGRFVEIFNLWVAPGFRRSGIATKLKRKLEEVAKIHDVNLIYTHTEEQNIHVVELNKKLGYKEIRRGPIWDEVIRISLIKHL
ncbi:GNAT family N-acetyltransferase [Paenibacillus hemerocallicola]|uniref:GNAT family N-acetyltransferase n=1 Tax=Paenibacillus hemerocallicola TaxID=1172614 RepID=A0A5C4TI49_9BACL|nr:GNAT family N-acetyltransferase [Paenibacillus hemerocallicola]TNJ68099.1 GNAT family N-acetyltransferase [Paenibacillus hemerocallicola]